MNVQQLILFLYNESSYSHQLCLYLFFGFTAEYCIDGDLTLPNQVLAFFLAMIGSFILFIGLEIEIIFVHIGDNTKITMSWEILHIKRHLLLETARKKINVNL